MNKPSDNIRFMRRALQLAHKGLYTTGSNPRVGCVLEKKGEIVGEGWHRFDGEKHAETMALQQAGKASNNATAWVTLEPCCHTGKQPPCTNALIAAGIRKVVIASLDPNPQVAGQGMEQLKQAGIDVEHNFLAQESQALNPGFYKRICQQLPWIRLKIAMSLDGKTAAADGSSQWITGTAARKDTMHWRARAQAIVTGSGTVLIDNPQMTARDTDSEVQQPHPVILDSSNRLPAERVIFQRPATLVSCQSPDSAAIFPQQVTQLRLNAKDGHVDLHSLCKWLADQGHNEVHVEAGAMLSGAFLQARLVDELLIYQAPILLGDGGRGGFFMPIESIENKLKLQVVEQRHIGKDIRIRCMGLS